MRRESEIERSEKEESSLCILGLMAWASLSPKTAKRDLKLWFVFTSKRKPCGHPVSFAALGKTTPSVAGLAVVAQEAGPPRDTLKVPDWQIVFVTSAFATMVEDHAFNG